MSADSAQISWEEFKSACPLGQRCGVCLNEIREAPVTRVSVGMGGVTAFYRHPDCTHCMDCGWELQDCECGGL